MTPGQAAHAAYLCDEARRGCDCWRDGQCPCVPQPDSEDADVWDRVARAALLAWLPSWLRWLWR
jgi:hypothetical protein